MLVANIEKNRQRSGKNAGEWTGRVEISKGEIPGSKCSIYGHILICSRLYRENVVSSVFSPDRTLISASAAPHCVCGEGGGGRETKRGYIYGNAV